ncbi:tyrosine-type recombinase/integrase [Mesorhizobium sp. NZP2077]|uniref:tyrosine-type recombinase/integrase n=1 Tax=Mesorhizobium sp. NZP2077 TaxID=2483404 RepID=UPI001554A73F|nr:tyrosine-type recombinase/integrase [Mesorhizobium sp. NZP2077]QKC86748.1 integrase [Mesorhizobium sp. NZP2077]QKD20447.1 tyrosine-type recombinase/integrase [Mesorhizobium sp. NZP2077]
MFEEIFFPRNAKKYRAAPLFEEREQYLIHRRDLGATRSSLRKCANNQLSLMHLLNLQEDRRACPSQVEAAAASWSQPKGRRCDWLASPKTTARFVADAVSWLRFLGWLEETETDNRRCGAEVGAYELWMRRDRGLSEATIRGYRAAADQFLEWLTLAKIPLGSISVVDVDDAVIAKKAQGTRGRRTIHDYAQRLRAFIRYSEAQRWCAPGIADGIMPPRFDRDEGIPRGLNREDVLRLLATTEGNRLADKRDRAILMLFIAYGLRAGEVCGLRLDDLDWENEIIRVRCPKTSRTQIYPLSLAVGGAIVRYIREARPSRFGRELFFTTCAPIRPVYPSVLGATVRRRLAALGIVTGKRGTHALRHAAAQHLLDQGMPMKVIGDFLGHRDPSSTAIYAKVNLAALREVAALDMEGLA